MTMSREVVDRRNLSGNIGLENKNYEEDMNHSMYYLKKLLQILGLWSLVKQNPRTQDSVVSILLITTVTLLQAFIVVPCTLHALLREQNPTVKMKLLAPIGLRLANFAKHCAFVYRRKDIKFCFDHVQTDWMMASTLEDREIMRKKAISGRRTTVLCMVFMYTATMCFNAILPHFRPKKMDAFNRTLRPVVYPGFDIFVNPQSSPQYEIIFLLTITSACSTYTIIASACSLAATFVAHVCGQIEIMMSRLDTLFDNLDDDIEFLSRRISFVIRCHVRVLGLTMKIEEFLREICLFEVVSSTLIICLLEYYCVMEWENNDTSAWLPYALVLISLSLNMFIFCHFGEILTEQCAEVGTATYMIDWWKMPRKTGQALVLVIAMANIPRKLTAGRMIELSVASFGTILKTSMVYLNMLRAMEE